MSFFDGGNKSLSFGEKGDNTKRGVWQGGVILNISGEQTSMGYPDSTKPKTFKNGDIVKKIVISLDTRQGRFPATPIDAEDDGTRDWHVDKGYGQYKAIGKALRDAKVGDIEVGGMLYVCWVSGEGNIGDPRQFQAAYQPPTGTGGFMQDAVAPPAQAPAAPSFPPQQPVTPANAFPAQQPPPAPYGFDPATGQPLAAPPQQPAPPANPAPYGYDPVTGQPLAAPPQQAPAQQPVPAAAGPVTNPFAQ
jgi:hypothetical protein